ncbi:uncharacterized protein LOC129256940 isoform X1 [Lytechinus pictus]|uniref:uncharacterized protein LOC129256940 isoform X1 n=1 Tax=Lytechinus pictus TaxID=7653 RepID=UPI00240E54A4|nr:uncharacterized protein LOC129256940 isoform X1 [Lytechinus pictus]
MANNNTLQLYRTLPLNDGENTQLFTFKLGLMNLDEFKSRSVRSTIINYQGQDWYLSCKYAEGKRLEYLGVYIYWGSPSEGVRCRADFRIITRNILDPTKSLVTEGSQVEFSAPQSPGWGKREFASLRELFTPGQGFLLEPEKIVIIELAMKSCSTLFEQSVDFTQLLSHREQPYPSFFTANFSLAGMEFYVSLYPLGDREEAEGHVSMYLHRFLGNEGDTSIIGCRIRYRFFLGHSRTCPTSSKTFEFSFKNEQGYGRFKAFEPLNGSDNLLYRGAVPLGVEVVSITPFAQPEIRLTTRGYYHTDNFVFEDAVFPDHRGNQWRLSAANSSQFLSLKLNAEDKNRLFSAPGLISNQSRLTKREECTKFIQWRAFVLSRTDRKKTLAVNGCPLSAYYSRGLMQTNYSMSTQIPLLKAKALDGDYCTKDEPSLLVRIEFLNVQDIVCVMTDYPTLDFERFQLYHTREGLKRCLKQNDVLVREMESLRTRLSNAMKESKDSRDLVQDFQRLIKHPIPPLSPTPDSSRNTQLMNWLLQQDSIPNKTENPSDHNKQLTAQSARPASVSSSPTLPVQPPVPRPRGVRGPPPRPPPRAYSPVATDLVSTRQFTYNPTTLMQANSLASPPHAANSAGLAMASDQQRLAVLNSNDTAFKRFSFTGINVTPAMISSQAAETSRNVDVSAQSSSVGKEPTSPKGSTPLQDQTPSTSSSSSVVMSKIGNGGSSRGFALARMTRPNVSQSQPSVNQTQSQQPQQSHSLIDQPVKWPIGMTPPATSHISHSTGDLEGKSTSPSHQTSQHLSNGDIGTNTELPGGFHSNLQQSFSHPNISTHSESNGQPLVGLPITSTTNDSKITSNKPSAIQNIPQRPLSGSMSKEFEFSPVPQSVVNRRSPVPEPQVHKPSPQSAITNTSGLNQPLVPHVIPRDQMISNQNAINTEESRNVKSTPSTPNKSTRKPVAITSKSTPNSPTKQPPSHDQQTGYGQRLSGNGQLQTVLHQQSLPSQSFIDNDAHIDLPQPINNHEVSTNRFVNSTRPEEPIALVQSEMAKRTMVNSQRGNHPVPELLSNGMKQTDEIQERPRSVVEEMKQINVGPVMNSNEQWSLPSIEQRRRMGVIETSL